MFTLAGLAIFVVMILGKTSKLIDERVSLSIGMVLTIISSVLLIPFGPGSLERPTIDVNGTSANIGEGGCPWKYSWCDSTPAMPVAQYVTALSIQGFGYPMLQSTAFFIYAKTLQPKHQGICMGVFSAMGNIGRLIGSLYGGFAYFKYGVQWAFGSSCIIISTMGIGIILLYPRLIPYTERKKQKDKYEEECYL
ncbi:major facilitator superfamily domain-containing protein 8-like [Antedon mediterranea]|uniref:major facilitator superfamily domain-containing protein 8-like n=1 Tax=Antedon mediterranea TaxID=105859 RepID=UPI003AF654F6